LSAGREITIEGTNATLLGANANAQSLTIIGDGTTVTGMTFSGVSGGDPAITFNGRTDITITQNTFHGFTDCIDVTNSKLVFITKNQLAPGTNGSGVRDTSGSVIRITGNTFTGFNPPNSQTGVLFSASDVRVDNKNTFTNLTVGANVTNSKAVVIDKNTFEHCQTVIGSDGASNLTVSNNGCSSGNTFFDGLNVGTKELSVNFNQVSIFTAGFKNFKDNFDSTISFNTFQSVGTILASSNNTNLFLRANNIFSSGVGFNSQLDKNIQIDKNIFQTCVSPINLQSDQSVLVVGNGIVTGDGIKVGNSTNVGVAENRLTNIQNQGVLSTNNNGAVQIVRNVMTNCGLSAGISPPAVVFASGAVDLQISKNSYTGSTDHLQFFIDTPVLGAAVIGNTTNTGLPNKIGP
jgi:hypothetical protein